MIYFGTRGSNLGSFDVPFDDCDYCQEGDTQRITVYGRYAHVFWIPLFPIGKKAFAECTHCKRTMEQKEFPSELQNEFFNKRGKIKTPIWHWFGVGIFGLLVGLTLLIGLTAEHDPRTDILSEVESRMVSNPTMESDSISYKMKNVFDEFTTEEINPNEFKYLTQVEEDKALILLQIPKLRKVKKEGRMTALELVRMVTDSQPDLEGKELYIGVKGLVSMILIQTPSYEANSKLANSSELYEFFGPKPAKEE